MTTGVVAVRFASQPSTSQAGRSGGAVSVPVGSLAPRAEASQRALIAAAIAIRAGHRDDYLARWAATPNARRKAIRTYMNLARLRVSSLELRVPVPGATRSLGRGRWSVRVDADWALQLQPERPATSRLRAELTRVGGSVVLTRIVARPGARLPIWLLPALVVRSGPRTLVAAADAATAEQILRWLDLGVRAVRAVLPDWHGRLVAYAPATTAEFARLVARHPDEDQGIAAVSTTVDGSMERDRAAAIVVNPSVFAGLGAVGARVVLAHEATHLATGAQVVSMPLWVAEGFADYVAIRSVHLPVAVAASVALDAVRRTGLPTALPRDAAFERSGRALESVYEQAWLAAFVIARHYGEQRLVAFYRDVQAHPDDVTGAFRRDLGTTQVAVTAEWRSALREVARAE